MTDEANENQTAPELVPPTDASATLRSPGAMIRSARERARVSVEDLASQIKLSRQTLEALEHDDFNQLLEPVYVRGYYRKCAKVLAISEKDLIDAYHGRALPKQPTTPSKLRLASGTELGSGNRLPLPMAIIAAVIVFFICVFVWNMVKEAPKAPALIPVPATSAVTEPVPAQAQDGLTPQFDATAPVAPESTTSPTAPAGAVNLLLNPPASAPAPARAPSLVPAPVAAQPAAATSPAVSPAVTPTGESGVVALSFSNTSWVRVTDASGKILLNGLLNSGDKKTLKGQLPLSVFLGNAPAVAVEFAGKPVDISQRVAENLTARFSLPVSNNP